MKRIWQITIGSILLGGTAFAQHRVDDKPEILDTVPRTKEELERKKSEQLIREAQTLYGLAIMHRRTDKILEAIATMERALNLDPMAKEVRKSLVPLYTLVGRESEAMTQCSKVLESDPTDADTAFQYARLLKAEGRPNDAIPVLQKAIAGKHAAEKPERLLFMLSDLFEFLERKGEFAAAMDVQDQIIRTIHAKREQLLFGNGFTRDDLQSSLARAHERRGQCAVKRKQYDTAMQSFRQAREALLQMQDADARRSAHRINWNISEMAAAQEKWSDALAAVDLYLEQAPVDLQPYERKLEYLRKLGRERDVVPALKRYAEREEFHVGLQLLLARELTKVLRYRGEALAIYDNLLKLHPKVEVYAGYFKLFQVNDEMSKVLDCVDEAVKAASAKPSEVKAEIRESAQLRLRAMLGVLRSEPALVQALLPVALAELPRGTKRELDTWSFLASLAANTRQLDKAEKLFRQCLLNTPPEQEHRVYSGLLQVLMLAKKYESVVDLCEEALAGRRPARNTNAVIFEMNLASALAELGRFDEALRHAEQAVKLSSEDVKVRQRCHKAEILARADRSAEAIRECEETLKEFPQPARVRTVRYSLANVYSTKGDYAKSEEQLRLILETDPESPLANNNLGYQLADRNEKLDDAEKMIRKAIDNDRMLRRDSGEDAENAAYLDSLGWVLFRKGQTNEAREQLERASTMPDGADDPTVWDHLGDVYAKLNMPQKAKEAWHTAMKLYEQSHRARKDGRRAALEQKLKVIE